MTKKRFIKLAACLLAMMLLSGCASSVPLKQVTDATLPPPAIAFQAPQGDTAEGSVQAVLLNLPGAQSGRLEYVQERILLSPSRHPAEFTLRRLFTFQGTTQASALTLSAQLALNPGSAIEISGDTATVNLAPSALLLDNQERYLVARAIANTLTQWGDVRYVNLLINHRQPGVDTAATLPLGSLGRTEDGDVAALWQAASKAPPSPDSPYSFMATLYYPVSAGRGIVSETQLLTSQGRGLQQLAMALLEGLSIPPAALPASPEVPDLALLLEQPLEVVEPAGSTGRIIKLAFRERLNEELIAAGIPRSVMMASLTYTLTTFLPYTAGITVTIGNEQIGALVPSGLYEGAGEQILFTNGLMQRPQFSRFLLDYCTLYFMNGQGSLSATKRAIPFHQAYNPRYLLGQLMLGPQNTDSVPGLMPVLPAELNDADLLGITRQNETALVNLSGRLKTLARDFVPQQELAMVYALVNTLTWQRKAREVCFFVDGGQEGTFAGTVDIAGVFLRNEGLIR